MSKWIPTHVQTTVVKARDLLVKGKQGQNESFVTIQLGKEKFQTSVIKCKESVEWNEECDLPLAHGSDDWLVLTAFHKTMLGIDEFLGRVELPLSEFDWHERPRPRWFPLRAKQGKRHQHKEHKYRGELQVILKFYVQNLAMSTPDISAAPKFKSQSTLQLNALKKSFGTSLRNLTKHQSKDNGNNGFAPGLGSRTKSQLSIADSDAGDNGLYMPTSTLPRNEQRSTHFVNSTNGAAVHHREPPVIRGDAPKPHPLSRSRGLASAPVLHNHLSPNGAGLNPFHSANHPSPSTVLSSRTQRSLSQHRADSNHVDDATNPFFNNSFRGSMMSDTGSHRSSGSEASAAPSSSLERGNIPPTIEEMQSTVSAMRTRVPKELELKYGHLERRELLLKIGRLEAELEGKELETERMKSYLESLLVRVMGQAPQLLQNADDP